MLPVASFCGEHQQRCLGYLGDKNSERSGDLVKIEELYLSWRQGRIPLSPKDASHLLSNSTRVRAKTDAVEPAAYFEQYD